MDFTELIKSELSETAHPSSPSFDGTESRFRGSKEIAEDGNRDANKTNSDLNMNSLGIRERPEFAGKSRQFNYIICYPCLLFTDLAMNRLLQ